MQTTLKYQFKHSQRIVLLIAILFVPVVAFSQKKKIGTVEYLKLCNGFKNIKLGADISEVPAGQLSYMDGNRHTDADSCMSYVIQDDSVLKVDSNFHLQQVGIRTYRNKIVNIYLFFSIKDSHKILWNFLHDFGQFNELPKEYAHIYDWNTGVVNLSLEYQAEVETGVAIFTNNELVSEINAMKERQKVSQNFIESLAAVTAGADKEVTASR